MAEAESSEQEGLGKQGHSEAMGTKAKTTNGNPFSGKAAFEEIGVCLCENEPAGAIEENP